MTGGAGGSGFAYYDDDLNHVNNDQFGTCTLDSLDPLTITYTINEGVTWSDGTPVDAADLIIEWAAQSGVFNDADTVVTDTGVTAQADEDGTPIVVGPDGADITSAGRGVRGGLRRRRRAARGLHLQGVDRCQLRHGERVAAAHHAVPGDLRGRPVGHRRRGTSFYVDYQIAGLIDGRPGPRRRPASARHRRSDGGQGGADRRPPDGASTTRPTSPTSRPSPSRTTRDFDATSLPDDPGIYAGYGPYNLVDFTEDGTMTFEAREDYTWGPQPKVADDRLLDHRRPDRSRPGDGERGDRHHPAAGDRRHPHPARGHRRSRHRGDPGRRRHLRAHRPGPEQRRPVRSRPPTAATPRRRWPCAGPSSTPCPGRTSSTG